MLTIHRAIVRFNLVVLLSLSAQAVSAGPACQAAFGGVTTARALTVPQYAISIAADSSQAFSKTQLARREATMNRLFEQLGSKVAVKTDIRFRELPMQGMTLPTTLVKSVFRDFDPTSEIIIGAQKENVEGRSHSYLLVAGQRYDGAAIGDRSWEPRPSNLIIGGMAFRVRGVPYDVIRALNEALQTNPKIVDNNCYSSMFRFLEKHGGVQIQRERKGLPILPSEYIAALLSGKLVTSTGIPLDVEAVNMTPLKFTDIMSRFVEYENKTMLPDPADVFSSLKSDTIDYHADRGW